MRPCPPLTALALVLALAPAAAAEAQTDGPDDASFSNDGWDFFNPSFSTGVRVDDLAVRPDGKLALTGRVFAVGDREALSCVRNVDGDGGVCVNLAYDLGGGNNNDGNGIAAQSDGRTVIVGDAQGPAGNPEWVLTLARMTTANTLDVTFNGGTGPFHLDAALDLGGAAVTVFADRVYFAGGIGVDLGGGDVGSDFFVGARDIDGTPYGAFSGDGQATAAFDLGGRGEDFAEAVAVDAWGRVVVGGTASDGIDVRFAVARFTAAGALDTTFSGDGRQTVPVDLGGGANLSFGGMAVDRFGRVVLAGVAATSGGSRAVVVRLTSGGILDTGFGGGDGIADFAYGAGDDVATVTDVIALTPPSDRLAVLGDYAPGGGDSSDGFLFVLTAAGAFDTTFNHTGKKSFAPASGDPWNHAEALAVQAGRLVALGGYHAGTTSVNLVWMTRVQVHLIFGDDFDAGHLGLWSSVAD